MLKNNLIVFFGFFLVSMLFVPPSISTTLAQDSGIPAWIKNNAGWWATDRIGDEAFVNAITYLIQQGLIQGKFLLHLRMYMIPKDHRLTT